MFTGIVEEVGRILSINPLGESIRLEVECSTILDGLRTGDSIAVDGCCLTAETITAQGFTAFASPETMRKTSLGERVVGDGVNLERALALGTRLGGHMVSGHVDETGRFLSLTPQGKAWELRIEAPPAIIRSSIPKGSICIDGISLTIVDLTEREISAWIIPETIERTTLAQKRPGQRVNLESDLIGKYVFRFLETRKEEG